MKLQWNRNGAANEPLPISRQIGIWNETRKQMQRKNQTNKQKNENQTHE